MRRLQFLFLHMPKLKFINFFYCCFLLFVCSTQLYAQEPIPAQGGDSVRTIQIVQGKKLREKTIDSVTTVETISGNVILIEGQTTFYCDSAVINRRTNIVEAFGHIHINQSDSIHTYAQYLKYIGNDRVAYLKKDVKLTDNKGILTTQDLEYDLKTSIAKYSNGGKVINGKTILTSRDGIYYSETKDVYFKNNVHLVDPRYDIKNDTLRYNTETQIGSWNTPTVIKSEKGGDIYSTLGTYDLKNGKALFGNRTVIKDSTRTYVADNSNYDEKTGIAQLDGNAVIRDSSNGYTILGNQLILDKNDNSFLATRKPLLIFKGEGNDSTFIAADTLFSGVTKKDTASKVGRVKVDTIKNTMAIDASKDTAIRYFQAYHHVRIFNDSVQSVCDSLFYSSEDSVFRLYQNPLVFSSKSQITGDTIYMYTQNKKAKRVFVFENAMITNKLNEQMYNQVGGRTINGYFKNGEFDYMRVKGSPAESIFYPQDDDSAFVGMNRSKGDVIDIYFVNKEVNKVKFINQVDGTMYPIRQIPDEVKHLKNFLWQDSKRPKTRFELFE